MKVQRIAMIVVLLVFFVAMALLVIFRGSDFPDEDPVIEEPTPQQDEVPRELEVFTFSSESFPRIDGSPATIPLAQAAASVLLGESREMFADKTVFTRTSQAFRNLANGLADILIVSEPTPGVLNELSSQGFVLEMTPIAVDALVFVVNASNPVSSLTSEQVRDIYTGAITNWQQVGGENQEIVAFQRNEEAASQVLMQKLVMDWEPMANAPIQNISAAFGMGEVFSEDAIEDDDFITAIRGFDGSAGAIGYTLLYYAENIQIAEGLKILTIDGASPGFDTIANGEYPFLNPYYAVIDAGKPEDGDIRIMYNWLLSDAGQALIRREGYVPLVETRFSETVDIQEMRWDVKTDDSNLSQFQAPFSPQSGQHGGSIQELVPSDDYFRLIPYSSAVTMNDGSFRVSKYGFMDFDGTVVTGLIYDNIIRASYGKAGSEELRAAYHLQKIVPYAESDSGFQILNAACSLEGNWITDFDYADIVFSRDVIFLMRDRESFDIDVYDYDGEKLYNILELEWAEEISEDTFAEALIYGVSEGVGFIKMDDDTFALMDMLTGEIERTEFAQAFSFSEGLAAVSPEDADDLWGFVDMDLEIVIEPEYVYETAFINGKAVVEKPDGSQHVIDAEGEVLHSVEPEYYIVQTHDGFGFSVHPREEWDYPQFFTNDLEEIEHPAAVISLGPESSIQYLSDGWYFCMAEDGLWVFNHDESFLLPPNRHLEEFIDGYIIYYELNDDFTIAGFGVMQPDGTDVVMLEDVASISPAVFSTTVTAFILNTSTMHGGVIREVYTRASYQLVDLHGEAVSSGLGFLMYDDGLGGFRVQGSDFFALLDDYGHITARVPIMGYSFD